MKRKNKIVLTSLITLVVGAVALYAFSLHESFSEYDDAFLLIEGEEILYCLKVNLKKH